MLGSKRKSKESTQYNISISSFNKGQNNAFIFIKRHVFFIYSFQQWLVHAYHPQNLRNKNNPEVRSSHRKSRPQTSARIRGRLIFCPQRPRPPPENQIYKRRPVPGKSGVKILSHPPSKTGGTTCSLPRSFWRPSARYIDRPVARSARRSAGSGSLSCRRMAAAGRESASGGESVNCLKRHEWAEVFIVEVGRRVVVVNCCCTCSSK